MMNTSLTSFSALLPGALLLLASCTTPGDTKAPANVSAASLLGTSWMITAIDGVAPSSPKASLRFDADRIGMTAGCNGIGGHWKLEQGRIVGGPYASTMMYCEGLMEQERALAKLLEEKPVPQLSGETLTLRSASHLLTATRNR